MLIPVLVQQPYVRKERLHDVAGDKTVTAWGRVQGRVDRSLDTGVVVSGVLDVAAYGGVLQPQALVGLCGVGIMCDGTYYVREVAHEIHHGSYKQRFVPSRSP